MSVLDGFGNKKYNDRNLSIFTRAVGLPAALKWRYIPIRWIPRGVVGSLRDCSCQATYYTIAATNELRSFKKLPYGGFVLDVVKAHNCIAREVVLRLFVVRGR